MYYVGLVDILPDDILLPIFDFCVDQSGTYEKKEAEVWQTLVHVCSRWRSVVFGSPIRLSLRLVCIPTTPARDTLDVWPALPLNIYCPYSREDSADNVLAVLDRSNRVYGISLKYFSNSDFEKIWAAMGVPFPELVFLLLASDETMVPVLPDSILGGSAPDLQVLILNGIPFPGLPKLLLSTTNLFILRLGDIPHSGYPSPEAIVAALAT